MQATGRQGLSAAEVAARRAKAGWNALPDPSVAGPWTILARQFSSFLILILVIAAAVALVLGERIDAAAIGLVVVLNAALGFVQEWRAETALAALRSLMAPKATVIREGREEVIPARELVPGDLILLETGDTVPADATLDESVSLRVDESVLTGESVPVSKGAPSSVVFSGTAIVAGRAEAEVTATGAATEFGQIAGLTGGTAQHKTHLERHLGRLATQLGLAALAIASGIALLGLALGRDMTEMLMTGLSLAVAIVPEGLPAVVTITLALGAAAMVRQHALARRLQAIETLGAASVICTDKTGTLTENKMTATDIWTPAQRYTVTGTGYDPTGHIARDGARIRVTDDPVLADLLRVAIGCTHARLTRGPSGWTMAGAPTEAALVTLAYKGWQPVPPEGAILAEIPFDSDRKRMSVVVRDAGGLRLLMKGAPEAVSAVSTRVRDGAEAREMTDADRAAMRAAYEGMAERGLRVIALADRETDKIAAEEAGMTFLGLVGLIDPPRAEVQAAIGQARSAAIRVLMVTGDSPVTARAIADQVGLAPAETLTGDALEALSDAELARRLEHDILFARTRPAEKMRIVRALQSRAQIVAMTGDGVNDAPALKQADIGVAMGIRGTDVAREAADLVLLDDNFATIVAAIGEGRRQFANIRKFVRYLLSSNAGEIVALVVNIALGGPLIFLATQILWMNLVTDGVTAVALGLEKAEPDHMEEPPRGRDAPILGWAGIGTIALFGLYSGSASLWLFFSLQEHGVELARTAAFTGMVVFEKVSVFAFRSLHAPCWRIGWLSNPLLLLALTATMGMQALAVYWPPLQVLLHTVPIGWAEWQLILALALPLLVVPELVKTGWHLRAQRTR
ncbi:Ca2+-transporting ATPase [Roseivivax lentus]|uniref:Ca2+-transporting ATPase n=1 Tax=Roseivivax lentus TaxID=633194 RepID=A0A1N7LPK0_9RHOB|nr:cation-transporting P-type ATPase [Roseivivax lentus]SIS75694.1 Ca2+-transporting ATPase [Roseivivax lentus]